jgi:hypothetical protein
MHLRSPLAPPFFIYSGDIPDPFHRINQRQIAAQSQAKIVHQQYGIKKLNY